MKSRYLFVGAICAAMMVCGAAARAAVLPVAAAESTHSISSTGPIDGSDNATGGTRTLIGPNGPASTRVKSLRNPSQSPPAYAAEGLHDDPKNTTALLALAVSEPATWGMMVLGVCLMAVGLRMMRARPVKTGASAGERFYTA